MRRLLLLLPLLLAVVLVAPAASGQDRRCPKGRVVDADRGGRVVADREGTYWACLRRRRPALIETSSTRNTVSHVRLASPYVAYHLASFTTLGTSHEVVLLDPRRDDARDASVDGSLEAIVVSRRGVAVFLDSGAEGRPPSLERLDLQGTTELDAGAIDQRSLAISRDGRTAYWTRDGVARSAAL